jgi:amino acid adenylation domain-containing protein
MLINRFEQQVKQSPNAPAVKQGRQEVTFLQLNRIADHVAAEIVKTVGRGSKERQLQAALLFEHGIDMIVGLLAALKANHVYVPLDRTYPEDRLRYMLDDSEASVILTNSLNISLANRVAGYENRVSGEESDKGENGENGENGELVEEIVEKGDWQKKKENEIGTINIIDIGTFNREFFRESNNPGLDDLLPVNLEKPRFRREPAYILYTSGSTGRPKGVVQNHESVLYYVRNWIQRFNITSSDRMTFLTAFSHDGAQQDIWSALLAGAVLCPYDVKNIREGEGLSGYLREEKITLWHSVPTLYRYMAGSLSGFDAGELRYILLGGEPLRKHDLELRDQHFPDAQLANVYGQTESSVNTIIDYAPGESYGQPVLGEPLDETEILLVNEDGEVVEDVGVGEIVVSSPYIADGYWKDPEKTGENFTDDPEEGTLYWTGDMGRLQGDGRIIITGRKDTQIKIRGFRVEVGEIETVLLRHEAVRECLVQVRSTIGNDGEPEQYLCCYYTASRSLEQSELREYLLHRLPDYMVPARYIQLGAFPLNPTGKIDRKALPDPEAEDRRAALTVPEGEIETQLAEIWARELGQPVERIGRESNFFELGGHSLRAINLISLVHKNYRVKLELEEIFERPGLEQMARRIEANLETDAYNAVEPVEKREYYPLSPAQKRLYFLQQMNPESTAYNISDIMVIKGPVDREKVRDTFLELIHRHEGLRTGFFMLGDQPVQQVHETAAFDVEYDDRAGVEKTGDVSLSVMERVRQFVRPFELSRPPLMRIGMIRKEEQQGNETYIIMIDIHHIIADGTTGEILTREYRRLMEGESLPPLTLQYKDYAQWTDRQMRRGALAGQETYWVEQFCGEIPVLELPTDQPRPAQWKYEGDNIRFVLSREQTRQVNALCRREDVTQYMILLAALNIHLSKLSGQEDIVIGTPQAGRGHEELENIAGMFINTLPIRNAPESGKTFNQFLREVKQRTLEALKNQDYPFEELVERISPPRDTGRNPLFDVMFTQHNYRQMPPAVRQLMNSGRYEGMQFRKNIAKLDLTIHAVEMEEGIGFSIEYSTRLFKKETVERYIEYYRTVLTKILKTPQIKIGEIEIISPEERERIVNRYNATQAKYPQEKTIHRLFQEQAERTPYRIALYGSTANSSNSILTYEKLNQKSNQLAQILRERGIRPNTVVAVKMSRSIDMIVTIMGILKAGGAYLPMDPGNPTERIRFMLKDSNAGILIEKTGNKESIPDVLNFDQLESECKNTPDNVVLSDSGKSTTLCYIIYTSGSTGRPKGVMIEHRSVVNRLNWMQRAYPIGDGDVIMQKTTYVFDVSVWELFWWSHRGAALSLPAPGDEKDPEAIAAVVERHRVTTMHFVPGMLAIFLESVEAGIDVRRLRSLRQVFASGEALGIREANRFNKLINGTIGTKLINLYGPTEATVDVSYYNIPSGENNGDIPIGKPIDNTQLYVLDKTKNLQPTGIAGELAIAGDNLARGYLNRPELTHERFTTLYGSYPSNRIYLTGDRALFLPDGNIRYLGRIDHQVKIRGYRIELGEIESRLQHHPGIKNAVVRALLEKDGDSALCAYIVPEEEANLFNDDSENRTREALWEYLKETLPDYMLPSYFIEMEEIPLNTNGKIDRKKLPHPGQSAASSESGTPPRSSLEKGIADIWSSVLGIEPESRPVGIDDNFFRQGGHSLRAAVLVQRLHRAFDIRIPLTQLFKTPHIRGLARYLEQAAEEKYRRIEKAPEMEHYPLSPAQKRLFILHQMEENNTVYNISVKVSLGSGNSINKTILEGALQRLADHQESLRTAFHVVDDEPVQVIREPGTVMVTLEDVTGRTLRDFVRPFELEHPPLLRVGIKETAAADDEQELYLDMHHIIGDGISLEIMARQIKALYNGEDLQPLSIQYKDYAVWRSSSAIRSSVQQREAYWRDRLGNGIPVLTLPADYPRAKVFDTEGKRRCFTIDKKGTAAIKGSSGRMGITVYMQLLAIVNIWLSKLSGQHDIIVGTPVSGRNHSDLENIVGMFVNTVAIRNKPEPGKNIAAFLEEVKTNTLEAFENQDYPFEELVDALPVNRDASRNPIFDVMFSYIVTGEGAQEQQTLTDSEDEACRVKFDLHLEALDRGETIEMQVDYAVGLFKPGTIQWFIREFEEIRIALQENPAITLNRLGVVGVGEVEEHKDKKAEEVQEPVQPVISTAPRTPVEKKLAEIWTRILPVERKDETYGIDENFFALGGHSLRATMMLLKVQKELEVKIPLAEVFRTPTIRGLATVIETAEKKKIHNKLHNKTHDNIHNNIHDNIHQPEPEEEREYYPLSPAQRRLYVLHRLNPAGLAYNMPIIMDIDGKLDRGRMEKALRELLQRHESLRTAFIQKEGEPVQIVSDRAEIKEIALEELHDDFIRPFDLTRPPLLRVGIRHESEEKYTLIIDQHHIISDGASVEIEVREFMALYNGESLEPLRLRYKDYALWLERMGRTGIMARQERYWLEHFSGELPEQELPLDAPRPQQQTFDGKTVSFRLTPQETRGLQTLGIENHLSQYMILQSAVSILAAKMTGREDIVLGTPTYGRNHDGIQDIVGMFVNTLAIRNYPEGGKTALQFMQEVKEQTIEAFQNQDYPFEELVDRLGIQRRGGRNPLFDVMVVFQNYERTTRRIPGLNVTYRANTKKIAKFDLTVTAVETPDSMSISLEYSTRLFKENTLRRIIHGLKTILHRQAFQPDTPISEIEITTEAERKRILGDFNNKTSKYPNNRTITEIFQEQVSRTPEQIALHYPAALPGVGTRFIASANGVTITYRELNKSSNELAGILVRQGISRNDRVAVKMEKSIDMIVAVLGILKVGAGYIPIAHDTPQERVDFILADSNAKILIINKSEDQNREIPRGQKILNLEQLDSDNNNKSNIETRESNFLSTTIAYIIYTSGSTGKPKGVPITHGNISPLLHWGYSQLVIGRGDRIVQNLSFQFDWSVWEMLITLTTGAVLVGVPTKIALDSERYWEYMKRYGITVLHITPAQWQYLISREEKRESLRYLFLGGEKLTLELGRRTMQTVGAGCRVFNMYGPTEATIIASVQEIPPQPDRWRQENLSSVPIGMPVGNTAFYILDKYGKPVPIGVPGELYIVGDGVARGYQNQVQLTRETFIPQSISRMFQPEKMLDISDIFDRSNLSYTAYRTGDRARWLEDGTAEYLGRLDHQVKVRGYRIEPGEIENHLLSHRQVREALVMARRDEAGDSFLAAYIVPSSTDGIKTEELRGYLSKNLPEYMIPSIYISLERLPMTPNGKVDRKALPEPEFNASNTGREYRPPVNQIETKLQQIWTGVLRRGTGTELPIGMDDNFFERGGNSIKLVKLISEIEQEFGHAVPMAQIISAPTIGHTSRYLIGRKISSSELEIVAALGEEDAPGTIFSFPPAVGFGLAYLHLAQLLEGYRMYAFNFIDGREDRNRMELYLDRICEIQPEGPVVLLGYSAGGRLCIDMAVELEKIGRTVSDIILMDSYSRRETRNRQLLEEIEQEFNEELKESMIQLGLESMIPRVMETKEKYRQYYESPIESPMDLKTVKAEIHLIRAEDKRGKKGYIGWDAYTEAENRYYDGYGNHRDMLAPGTLEKNAQLIRDILEGKAGILTPALCDAHRNLSRTSEKLVEYVRRRPDRLKHSNYADIRKKIGNRLPHDWPTFAGPDRVEAMKEAAVETFKLMRGIPFRVFDGNIQQMSRYYGLPENMVRTQMTGVTPEKLDRLMGRGDYVLTAGGFKCIEYNVSGNIGGLNANFWKAYYLENEIIDGFLKEYKLRPRHINYVYRLLEHMVEIAAENEEASGDQLNLAIVMQDYGAGLTENSKEAERLLNDAYREIGGRRGDVIFCDYPHLSVMENRLYHVSRGKKQIHVLLETNGGAVPPEILELMKHNRIQILNGPVTGLLSNKLNHAILSEHCQSDRYTEEEKAAIMKYIPWSRKIENKTTSYKGETVALMDLIKEERQRFIIKPAVGMGGQGVWAGDYTMPREWEKLLQQALKDGKWLVQERLESEPLLYQTHEDRLEPHDTVWGMAVFGDRYGGGFVRVIPVRQSCGIVNVNRGALSSVVIEMEE